MSSLKNKAPRKKVLAISSGGGHWVQLNRLKPAFENCDLTFATVKKNYCTEVGDCGFAVITDSNRSSKFKLIKSAFSIFSVLRKLRPDAVISTGAAPGYFAILIGKLLGVKTIWVDSIANAEVLSLSGQKAGKHADLWVTQWEHLARPQGPHYFGNVLGSSDSSLPNSAPLSPQSNSTPLKILVTVGTEFPFDRLVKTLDNWSADQNDIEVFAQTGESNYSPKNITHSKFLEPDEFIKKLKAADIIISHAGMGTILSSLKFRKPLIVLPRIAAKGEQRNEHQLATAKYLSSLKKVNVANNESELLDQLNNLSDLEVKEPIGDFASVSLTDRINTEILT